MDVCLVGCGGIAGVHLESYKRIENVKIAALCDLDVNRARAFAARFGVGRVFTDYMDMVEAVKPDLVDVCTPVTTHAKIVCDLARTVPAVLVEKPMALNVSECDEMMKEIAKHGVKLCVGHNQLFLPVVQRAKAIVDSGGFDVFSFRTVVKENFEFLKAHGWAADWNVSPKFRGIIWESCCHLAYLHLHFLPNICEVYAVGGKLKYPVYDDFAVMLRTDDRRYGVIELSWLAKEAEIAYELRSKSGRRLEMLRDYDYLVEKNAVPPYNVPYAVKGFFVDGGRVLKKWVKYGLRYVRRGRVLPTYLLIRSFVDSVEKGLPSPVSPEDGKKTIALLECIEKSLDEAKPVALRV